MDGTLFATNFYSVDRTALLPSSGEVLDGTWARKVAQQQIRAFGFAGKLAATMLGYGGIAPFSNPQTWKYYQASATVSLPFNSYGTSRPPMLFVSPQYGSIVVYKQFQDEGLSLSQIRQWTAEVDNPTLADKEVFRTWVDDLHYDTVTIGGVSGFRWSFTIRHKTSVLGVNGPFVGFFYKSPYEALGNAWFPSGTETGISGTGYVWLNWYALGVDTSAQL